MPEGSGRCTDAARPGRRAWQSCPGGFPRGRYPSGIRRLAVGGDTYRSPAPRYTPIEPFGRAAAAPEDLRLNGQDIAVFLRIPCFGPLPLDRLHAPFD